ncbi:P-loop containing nucleoside triphosphate hydrolase protein [Gilbertella persicaria]|uniref:P-loop containing nucleoside triphosphate hydrolase protein n=1 Tax=Gilbertella persicaria TaxID=101096 RepID=UPI00221F06A1|nr:P-loop containing nucleoside triphosphate hydrolase protein [Gilbertella persicaria]KAI8094907.1 P-loop containing nucleoside triphosphate hydrolase protein [Gilbertella persicaria]
MSYHCSLSNPWIDNDFVPCFRETVLDGAVLIAVLAWSVAIIAKATIKYYKSYSTGYTPLLSKLPTNSNNYYGTVNHHDNDDDTASDDTVAVMDIEIKTSRWTIYNCSRTVLSLIQLCLFVSAIKQVLDQKYHFSANEGNLHGLLFSFGTRTGLWLFALILSLVNMYLSSSFSKLANKICNQLNWLYLVDFLVILIDMRSYYNLGTNAGDGYSLFLKSGAIDLLLIIIIANESRLTPTEPIVTENGRTLSGENWASLYSKFMFSWVNVMMKEGYRRTLDDKDLVELPANNRAKTTLINYNSHKSSPSIVWTLAKTFRWELFYQTLYCLGWSVLIFGPPFFLNLIIKFIENPKGEPVTTAFLYVVGLLVTNGAQSLLLQQGLYIGRTLGIRIQSIVIGEVFSKSLRRRDDSGFSNVEEEKDEKKKDAKGNVNNLLSVDAQKVAEIAAYIFYLYCYPLQIIFSIWSLYKLLGNAALWGVLVMLCCQPVTYLLSSRFESSHSSVMSATDKRLKLMNELLSAIRIVKFFAWENEFKKRIIDAREKELGAIRSRLMMFMWMICAWFLIPILIMVTVFYVYTINNTLTASVAFTALALFNTFRAALDEFPLLITLVLQANVSVKRVEKFLAEDEVELPVQTSTVNNNNNVIIGFTDNATFSWDHNKDGNNKPSIKNLNLSFPVGKLSIVCGPTGSGKTTLISSLLGETFCLSGKAILPRIIPNKASPLGGAVSGIAYVAQTAWLQNCSIRDNILFGLPFDQERYEKVLYMTALTRDLEILEFGDDTEVGEKGVTLSGGQKQRVAIARAVYSQATTVILDDCLSAVDAHTAKHLYEHCLTGEYMRHRTVILVTHQVGLCLNGSSYVVALKDGEVAGAGSPKDMAEEAKAITNEEKAVEGPIPLVPKTIIKKENKNDGGKLTKDEERAEGSVTWSVYKTYIFASGGYWFWIAVLFLFCLCQGCVLAQDYWIKVWSAAYGNHPQVDANATFVDNTAFSVLGQNTVIQVYTEAIKNPAQQVDVAYYLGIYSLIGVIAAVMTALRMAVLFNGSLKASRRIHSQLLERILRAKVRFYDTTPLGRIVNRFSADLATIDQEVGPSLSFLLFSVVATLFIALLISSVTPAFLVPGVVIAIMFSAIGSYYLSTSRDMKRLNSVSRSPIYVQFNESVNGVATIRAFGSQQRFIIENHNKIDSNNRPFLWMWVTNRWLHSRVDLLGAFVSFCTGFVLVLGRDWIDPGLAGLSLSYALTFVHQSLWIIRMYSANEMNMNAIERVHEYLDVDQEPPTHVPETEPSPQWPEHGSVQVKDLVMQYAPENPPVLRNVNFTIHPREKIGIVGRTGSGKSTLALSIFRFMEPTQGSILIDGVDIHKIGLDSLRSRLTIIPQDPVLFSGTLRSNLDPFDQYDDAQLWAALKRSHLIDEQQQDITLDSPVTENGSNWSQGQRQLIALARALVKKTGLIILDEATSSVDFDTDHKIQQTIRTEFTNSTLLCIAHRIRTVADYDRILVLDHGQVKEFDTPYHLMTQEDSIFHQMCKRSGEYEDLLAIATEKHHQSS